MSQPGFGVMLNMLSSNETTVNAIKKIIGKEITALKLEEPTYDPYMEEKAYSSLAVTVSDGTVVLLYDGGQSCCETRYMRTDDDLKDFVGAVLTDVEIRNAAPIAENYGDHEIQFLVLKTSEGDLTLSNHNVHNGYYGGFAIQAREMVYST